MTASAAAVASSEHDASGAAGTRRGPCTCTDHASTGRLVPPSDVTSITSSTPRYSLQDPSTPTSPGPSLSVILKSQFERCRISGIVRNDPLAADVLRRRIVPGRHGMVAEHEPALFARKRPAAIGRAKGKVGGVDMAEPFDPAKFHFNRVRDESGEVLAVLRDGTTDQSGRHRILVNVSPLMYGHGLLIPYSEKCLPQQLTGEAIDLAVRLLRRDMDHAAAASQQDESLPKITNANANSATSSDEFCIGFNSLGAFSSVNHLHLHVLYPSELDHAARGERLFPDGRNGFPIAYAPVRRNVATQYRGGPCRVDELNWTVPCFSFQTATTTASDGNEDDDRHLSRAVASFVQYLHHRRIPHNVLFLQERNTDAAIRCIVIPRQHQDNFDADRHGFNAALGEISGMLIARTRADFDAFRETDIVEQLRTHVACDERDLEDIYEELQQR